MRGGGSALVPQALVRRNPPCGAARLLRVAAVLARYVLVWAAALSGVNAAAAAPVEEVRYEVEIYAPGNLKELLQENLSLILWRDSDGKRGRIDADQLRRLFDQGKAEIERLVATEGYYAPTISADLEELPERWVARYRVEPNTVTTIEAVELRFTGAIAQAPPGEPPDVSALREQWTLTAGEVFRQPQWEAGKRRLLQELLVRTYPFAEIAESRAEVDVRTSKAKLFVTIASGPAVRFGPLEISGLKRYPPETVRNLDPIDLGELYSQQKIFEFQRRLLGSGYFARAEVGIDARADPGTDLKAPDSDITKSGDAPDPREVSVPLRVRVEENTSKQLSLGLGLSTNSGPRASVSYNVLNLFGSAVQLRTTLAVDRLKQALGSDLVFPTTAAGSRYSISSFAKREDVQGQLTRGAGISGKRAWGPERTERFTSIDYLYEQKNVSGLAQTATQTLGANYGVTFRRTDNLLVPTSGYVATAQVGAGVRIKTGEPFSRIYGKAVRYQPLPGDNSLILRGELGAVAGKDPDTLPSALVFRAGGDQSVRGYGYQSLGVRRGDAIVGGRYVATGTVEVVHWLAPRWPTWGVAGFVDAGNAGNTIAALKPVVAYGAGARWRSPVGVLDLDVARGVDNGSTRIHFSLGVSY